MRSSVLTVLVVCSSACWLLQDVVGGLTVFFAAISSLSAALAGLIGAGPVGLALSYSLKV